MVILWLIRLILQKMIRLQFSANRTGQTWECPEQSTNATEDNTTTTSPRSGTRTSLRSSVRYTMSREMPRNAHWWRTRRNFRTTPSCSSRRMLPYTPKILNWKRTTQQKPRDLKNLNRCFLPKVWNLKNWKLLETSRKLFSTRQNCLETFFTNSKEATKFQSRSLWPGQNQRWSKISWKVMTRRFGSGTNRCPVTLQPWTGSNEASLQQNG